MVAKKDNDILPLKNFLKKILHFFSKISEKFFKTTFFSKKSKINKKFFLAWGSRGREFESRYGITHFFSNFFVNFPKIIFCRSFYVNNFFRNFKQRSFFPCHTKNVLNQKGDICFVYFTCFYILTYFFTYMVSHI